MTNQEAIEELQLMIDLIKQNGKDWLDERDIPILSMAIEAMKELNALREQNSSSQMLGTSDLIDRRTLKEQMIKYGFTAPDMTVTEFVEDCLPSAQPEIIRCKDCEHWRQQTNFQGFPLLFGFCESDDMWRSLYGKTTEIAHIDTDYNHYCGFAERRTDE